MWRGITHVPSRMQHSLCLPTEGIWEGCFYYFYSSFGTSHNLIVLSLLAEATVFPSLLIATHETASVWPFNKAELLPLARSQIPIVWSALPEINFLPSGLNATE